MYSRQYKSVSWLILVSSNYFYGEAPSEKHVDAVSDAENLLRSVRERVCCFAITSRFPVLFSTTHTTFRVPFVVDCNVRRSVPVYRHRYPRVVEKRNGTRATTIRSSGSSGFFVFRIATRFRFRLYSGTILFCAFHRVRPSGFRTRLQTPFTDRHWFFRGDISYTEAYTTGFTTSYTNILITTLRSDEINVSFSTISKTKRSPVYQCRS